LRAEASGSESIIDSNVYVRSLERNENTGAPLKERFRIHGTQALAGETSPQNVDENGASLGVSNAPLGERPRRVGANSPAHRKTSSIQSQDW
jgi:hypothetical protein